MICYRDYQANPQLDRYEERGLDEEDYDPLDLATRNAVDAQLRRRDVEIRRREGRLANAFMDGLDEDEDAGMPIITSRPRRRHNYDVDPLDDMDDDAVVSDRLVCVMSCFTDVKKFFF